MIVAALDCDADAIEEWNRWYDLEHTPMNVCLDGVMLSRRYVAPPALHRARVTAEGSPWSGGRAAFLTTYVLTGDPQRAFEAMSTELPRLYEEGRMRFPADKKVVREGDVFVGVGAVGRTDLQLRERDVPFVGHTGIVLVQRQGGDAGDSTTGRTTGRTTDRAARLADVDGVTGAWTLRSGTRDGVTLDMVFVEGDPAACATRIRGATPADGEVLVDAPFQLIDPLRYPWAEDIRGSELPQTIA